MKRYCTCWCSLVNLQGRDGADLQNQEYKRIIYSTNAGTKSQSENVAGLHGTAQNKMSDSKIKRWNTQHVSNSRRVVSGSDEQCDEGVTEG